MGIEVMKQALEALDNHNGNYKLNKAECAEINKVCDNLRQAIAEAEKQEQWKETDMAYRPNGLPQKFIHHEVESPDAWSEWVCPEPEQYFMKCCDCGLVHEMQFKVAKYSEGDECEFVDDVDTQAVFRARRAYTPKREWVGLTDEEKHKTWYEMQNIMGWYSFQEIAQAVEAKLKEKNT